MLFSNTLGLGKPAAKATDTQHLLTEQQSQQVQEVIVLKCGLEQRLGRVRKVILAPHKLSLDRVEQRDEEKEELARYRAGTPNSWLYTVRYWLERDALHNYGRAEREAADNHWFELRRWQDKVSGELFREYLDRRARFIAGQPETGPVDEGMNGRLVSAENESIWDKWGPREAALWLRSRIRLNGSSIVGHTIGSGAVFV